MSGSSRGDRLVWDVVALAAAHDGYVTRNAVRQRTHATHKQFDDLVASGVLIPVGERGRGNRGQRFRIGLERTLIDTVCRLIAAYLQANCRLTEGEKAALNSAFLTSDCRLIAAYLQANCRLVIDSSLNPGDKTAGQGDDAKQDNPEGKASLWGFPLTIPSPGQPLPSPFMERRSAHYNHTPPPNPKTNHKTPAQTTKTTTPTPTPKEHPQFNDFYTTYPRKVGKQAASKAFTKACQHTNPTTIIQAAHNYANDPNLPEKRFIPHPATWLNQGRWEDEPQPNRNPTPHTNHHTTPENDNTIEAWLGITPTNGTRITRIEHTEDDPNIWNIGTPPPKK